MTKTKTNKPSLIQFCVSILFGLLILQCAGKNENVVTQNIPFEKDYATYKLVLQNFVDGKLVNYRALKKQRNGLDNFVSQLATLSKSEFKLMSQPERMAFWINAYNGLTLRSIIDAYPVSSIKDIKGVWDEKRWKAAGQMVTLNEIEHQILRPVFKDARIHFAVNCASIGCPPLLNQPFRSDILDHQLDQMARRFVNDPEQIIIDPGKILIKISELYSWFGVDFVPSNQSPNNYPRLSREDAAVISFIFSYTDSANMAGVNPDLDWSLEFGEYDWKLNETR